MALNQTNKVQVYTTATLPAASSNTNRFVAVSDDTAGYVLVYSNGTNWLRTTDAATIGSSPSVSFDNGSAASPSIYFTSDPDTGLYRIGANQIGISTGGVYRVDITSSGLTATQLTSTGSISSSTTITAGTNLIATDNVSAGGDVAAGGALSGATISGLNTDDDAVAAAITITKRRDTNILQNSDGVGTITFKGYDGVTDLSAAQIVATVNGTPVATYMPVNLEFKSTSSSGTLGTRLKFSSSINKVCIPTIGDWGGLLVGTDVLTDNIEGDIGVVGYGHIELRRYQADAGASKFRGFKARGSQTTPVIVNNGDSVGLLEFLAYDGGTYRPNFSIESLINGSPGTLYVPSEVYFKSHDQSGVYNNRLIFSLNRTYLPILGAYDGVSVGTSSNADGFSPRFGVIGASFNLRNYSTDNGSAFIYIDKSRGTQSSPTTVVNSDNIGDITSRAFDGTTYREVYKQAVTVNGTVSTGVVPVDTKIWSTDSGGTIRVRAKYGPTRNYLHGSNGSVTGVTIGTDGDPSGATENITLWGNTTARRRYTSDASGVGDTAYKARGTITTPSTILTGDAIHYEQYYAHDGTSFVETYRQSVEATGTVSTGVIPGLVKFWTNDSAGALRVRMVFGSTRNYLHGANGSITGVTIGTDADVSGATENITLWGSTVARRRYTGDASGVIDGKYKARGSVTSPATVNNGDTIHISESYGHDGTSFVKLADWTTLVNGTVATGQVPVKLTLRLMNTSGSLTNRFIIDSNGDTNLINSLFIDGTTGYLSIGSATTTAQLHFKNGSTTSAGTAPIKFTAGTNMTIAEAGAIEYDGSNLFYTVAGPNRRTVVNVEATQTISGNKTLSGLLTSSNGRIKAVTRRTTGSSYTTLTTDSIVVFASGSSGTCTLMASPETGREFILINRSGGTITVSPTTGNIHGNASYNLTNDSSITVYYESTEWVIA